MSSTAAYTDINSTDPISYRAIKNDMYEWRIRGTKGSKFNELDQPGHLFFKVLFHFWNGDAYHQAENITNHNGLLTPAWLLYPGESIADIAKSMSDAVEKQLDDKSSGRNPDPLAIPLSQNCAFNFLIRNDELERAEKLKQFIELLSNISTYSPWYFMEVGGLDALLERPFKHDDAYVVEAPKQITIKCLTDSEDNRIATLLDLYRDVAYSHIWHREVLPANLRKFDMSIYIYGSPIATLHSLKDKYGATMKTGTESDDQWHTSYKRIELHNCEIDYNSSKTGYGGLNNAEGFGQEFTITLNVDDAYEYRYNTYMDRVIGDMVAIDMLQNTYSDMGINNIFTDAEQVDDEKHMDRINHLLHPEASTEESPKVIVPQRAKDHIWPAPKGKSIDLFRLADDLTGNRVGSFIGGQILGNIYKTSISDMARSANRFLQSAASGNAGGVIKAMDEMTEVKNGWYAKSLGNINDPGTIYGRTKNI